MKTYKDYLDFYQKKFNENLNDEYIANYLLAHVLKCDLSELFTYFYNDVNKKIIRKYEKYCKKCLNYVPPHYVTHQKYFYYLNFYVNKNVLIPRKETEELVDLFLRDCNNFNNLKILDMCCGSGCIGLSIKNKCKNFDVTCSDISSKALKVCKRNSRKLNLDIKIIKSNLFSNIVNDYDVIICNPPYISLDDKEVSRSSLLYEPKLALFTSDSKGIEFYDLIFRQLLDMKFQKAYFEFGYSQKDDLLMLLNKYNLHGEFFKDLSGKDRMLVITK